MLELWQKIRSVILMILFGILLVLSWQCYRSLTEAGRIEDSSKQAQVNALLRSHKAWMARSKAVLARSEDLERQADVLHRVSAAYRAERDSLARLADSLGTAPVEPAPSGDSSVVSLYWQHRAERDELLLSIRGKQLAKSDSALRAKGYEADSLRLRGDGLYSQLAAANERITDMAAGLGFENDKANCKILGFIKCPSRTATFFAGAGVGFVGGLLVSR